MISSRCIDSSSCEVVKMVTQIYSKFVTENAPDCDKEKLYANILWKWPDFLKEEMNKLVKFEEVVEAINSSSISL